MLYCSRRFVRAGIAGIAAALLMPGIAGAAGSDTLFGQTQSYDVLLRANGNAITTARFEVANQNEPAVSTLRYELKGGTLTDIAAYEEVMCNELPVVRVTTPAATPTPTPTAQTTPGTGSSAAPITDNLTQPPAGLAECYPNWSTDSAKASRTTMYYSPSGSLYKKVDIAQKGNAFLLTLPQGIAKGKSATVIMSYTAAGYVKPAWGGYNFKFLTLSSNQKTSSVEVSVSVDEDYQLAGAGKSKVVSTPTTADSLGNKLQSGASSAASARAYVDTVGTNGTITKNASSLAADETFTVSGRFAESAWLLYPGWLLVCVIGLIVLIAAGIWWWRRRKARPAMIAPVTAHSEVTPGTAHHESVGSGGETLMAGRPRGRGFVAAIRERRLKPRTIGWLCGLLTAGSILLTGLAAIGVSGFSNYYSDSEALTVVAAMLVVTAGIFATVLAAIGLPVWYGTTGRERAKALLHALLAVVACAALAVGLLAWNYYHQKSSSPDCGYNIDHGSYCLQD